MNALAPVIMLIVPPEGRPNADRSWTECFAQLVGTVLSLWDAGALDAAGEDGEVAPTFINLADASIKMVTSLLFSIVTALLTVIKRQIETLPTRSQDVQPLQNVLSVSTAGKNRYLFHFNSLHSLTQWTAGIRLAMFEHATLQEAYTGSLVAGKGKSLNNIRVIMDRSKVKTEDWARVRFGAGTPWRRCWCVISPPDEKEIQKQQKSLKSLKKRSAYDRSSSVLKGDVKFYDTKKTKKAQPIATITDAYSAYAIYPQSKPLIDQSTLVKVEGTITIHSAPETITEGFVFVMPEVHPAVTGFEMMLRWLFPVYDVFGLYGRPGRLVADTLDVRSLMFAMPQEKRYGYLEILDVAGLIHSEGSQMWKEKDWRKQLKELTAKRITSLREGTTRSRMGSRSSSNRGHRNSLPGRNGSTLRFDDNASIRSSPSIRHDIGTFATPPHTGSAPPGNGPSPPPRTPQHQRSVSEATAFLTPRHQRSISEAQQNYTPSRLSYEATPAMPQYETAPPLPPVHRIPVDGGRRNGSMQQYAAELEGANERSSSESERRYRGRVETEAEVQDIRQNLEPNLPPSPVVAPPAFAHQPGAKPPTRPYHSAELRRANSRMSTTTLSQLAEAGNFQNPDGIAAGAAATAWRMNHQQGVGTYSEDHQRGVNDDASKSGMIADHSSAYEGMVLAEARPTSSYVQAPSSSTNDGQQPLETLSLIQNGLPSQPDNLLQPSPRAQRSASPLSQSSTHSSPPPSLKVMKNFSRLPPQQPSQDLQPTASDSANIIMKPPPVPIETERPDMLKRHSTSRSITRKPVPGQSQQTMTKQQPALPARSSLESLRQHTVGQDALEDAIPRKSLHSTASNEFDTRRRSDNSSNYDQDSTVSPDYASTRKSMETSRSVERPRTGVLKTVGTLEAVEREVQLGDVRYRADQSQDVSADIPSIDFGPTHALNPGSASRPATGNAGQRPHERTVSAERPSTANQLNGSHVHTSRPSPGRPDGPGHSRSSSRNLVTPEPGQGRSSPAEVTSERPRSMAWQPGATIGSGSPGNRQSITPEQFVQQRAASGRVTPIFAHAAKRSATPPPVSRNSSGDWSQQQGRVTPTKETPRPQSRVVTPMINSSAGDYTARLSAREQEHVARMTGSPLINVPRQGSQGGGLIGAIEAREREKKEMKEGLSGQMVQNAIAQRQQQVQGHQYGQQGQPQTPGYQYGQQAFPSPSPGLAMPGQYPQTPQVPNPGRVQSQYGGWGALQTPQYNPQQQQQWVSPAAQLYWSTPQAPSPYSQEPHQQGQYQQGQYQQGQLRQGQFQQGHLQQNHQQNGSYFGNAHGGR